jgi:hypothetical protein
MASEWANERVSKFRFSDGVFVAVLHVMQLV